MEDEIPRDSAHTRLKGAGPGGLPRLGIDRQGLECGAIIGIVQLGDVVWYGGEDLDARADEHMSGTGVPACYGFLLDSPRQLPEPILPRGGLRVVEVRAQGQLVFRSRSRPVGFNWFAIPRYPTTGLLKKLPQTRGMARTFLRFLI